MMAALASYLCTVLGFLGSCLDHRGVSIIFPVKKQNNISCVHHGEEAVSPSEGEAWGVL